MRTVWTDAEIDAPIETLWTLLTDVERWPEWGPTVSAAELHGDEFTLGATGVVSTPFGVRLPFVITDHRPMERWSWSVAGVRATDHRLARTGSASCQVGFGVPGYAVPYLTVCRRALRRLEQIATTEQSRDGR